MRDNLINDLTKMTTAVIEQNDNINKKLIRIIIIQTIVLCITAIGIPAFLAGFYFLSDYQYPEVSQEAKQQMTDKDKSVKMTQTIKGGDK